MIEWLERSLCECWCCSEILSWSKPWWRRWVDCPLNVWHTPSVLTSRSRETFHSQTFVWLASVVFACVSVFALEIKVALIFLLLMAWNASVICANVSFLTNVISTDSLICNTFTILASSSPWASYISTSVDRTLKNALSISASWSEWTSNSSAIVDWLWLNALPF